MEKENPVRETKTAMLAYRVRPSLLDRFRRACAERRVYQTTVIEQMMSAFIRRSEQGKKARQT